MTKENVKTEISIETVEALLSKLQRELVVPKSRHNKFGGYNYRSCEDILDAVKQLLPDGAYVRLSDEPILIGDWHYIKATASLSYAGEDVVAYAYAREEQNKKGMDSAQVTGSTSSYARKYALNGLFCIDDVQDPDAGEPEKRQETKAPEKKKDDSKAREWIAGFAGDLIKAETAQQFSDLLHETHVHRDRIAAAYPDLVAGLDGAIAKAEERLKNV